MKILSWKFSKKKKKEKNFSCGNAEPTYIQHSGLEPRGRKPKIRLPGKQSK